MSHPLFTVRTQNKGRFLVPYSEARVWFHLGARVTNNFGEQATFNDHRSIHEMDWSSAPNEDKADGGNDKTA